MLDSVTIFVELIICMSMLILLNLLVTHKLKFSHHQNIP